MQVKFTLDEKKNDLVIKCKIFFRDIRVFYQNQQIGAFKNKKEAQEGKNFNTIDGHLITIKLLKNSAFQVIKNNQTLLPYHLTQDYLTREDNKTIKIGLGFTSFQILIALFIVSGILKVTPENINISELILTPIAVCLVVIWAIKKQLTYVPEALCFILLVLYRADMSGFSFVNTATWISYAYFKYIPLWPIGVFSSFRSIKALSIAKSKYLNKE